jgi:beta-galactosidase/beta-glucuronidase
MYTKGSKRFTVGLLSTWSIYYDVKRIKDAGLNFIRGSHYPHDPAFYAACDELGILVLDSQTGWQHFNDTPAFKNNTFQELRDMIRRDRNHASIVARESSLNESDFSDAWAKAANDIVHAEYPGDQGFSASWKGSYADIFIDASHHNVRSTTDPRPIIIDEYGDWDYGGASSTSCQAREAGDVAMLTQADNIQDGEGKNMALPWFSADAY